MKIQASLAALAAFSFQAATSQTVLDIAANDGRFTTLLAALTQADLNTTLQGPGPFTVFAPTDDAFAGLPEKYTKYLQEDEWKGHLADILKYHVIGNKVTSANLTLDQKVETLNGENVTVTSLSPPKVNGANITGLDIPATNGVVHVVDKVLLPSSTSRTLVDIVFLNPEFSTLLSLAARADLSGALLGPGPFTIFAPTNDAFADISEEQLDEILDPANNATLVDILSYHIVEGIVLTSQLSVGTTVSAINGRVLNVTSMDPVTINDSLVLDADQLVKNGVLHSVGKVIMP